MNRISNPRSLNQAELAGCAVSAHLVAHTPVHRSYVGGEEAVLLSDSTLVVDGIRGAHASSRQLLYRSGSVYVDMRLESQPGSGQVVLIGQILDLNEPTHGMGRIPVCLLSHGTLVSRVTTNDSGEFDFGMRDSEGEQIVFSMENDKNLVFPIPQEEISIGSAQNAISAHPGGL